MISKPLRRHARQKRYLAWSEILRETYAFYNIPFTKYDKKGQKMCQMHQFKCYLIALIGANSRP